MRLLAARLRLLPLLLLLLLVSLLLLPRLRLRVPLLLLLLRRSLGRGSLSHLNGVQSAEYGSSHVWQAVLQHAEAVAAHDQLQTMNETSWDQHLVVRTCHALQCQHP